MDPITDRLSAYLLGSQSPPPQGDDLPVIDGANDLSRAAVVSLLLQAVSLKRALTIGNANPASRKVVLAFEAIVEGEKKEELQLREASISAESRAGGAQSSGHPSMESGSDDSQSLSDGGSGPDRRVVGLREDNDLFSLSSQRPFGAPAQDVLQLLATHGGVIQGVIDAVLLHEDQGTMAATDEQHDKKLPKLFLQIIVRARYRATVEIYVQ